MVKDTLDKFNQFLIGDNTGSTWLNQGSLSNSPSTLDKLGRQNSLLMMMERFDDQRISEQEQTDHLTRLHDEILLFRESVRDILQELWPVKEQLIQSITQIIKKTIPASDVKVYGSHATKLCLPWSDIDLVIVPPKNEGYSH